jgi:hypothetical protein
MLYPITAKYDWIATQRSKIDTAEFDHLFRVERADRMAATGS